MASQNADSGIVLVGDKTATHKPADPPKFEYQPSQGDYRDAQAHAARTLKESNTFLFHDLKLPQNADLLATINAVSITLGDKTAGMAQLSDGSVLAISKQKGHVSSVMLARPDGSEEVGNFDAKMNTTSDVVKTALGTRTREYYPSGVTKSESNKTETYSDKLEFNSKGKLTHMHSETFNDVIDDRRLPDGSGSFSQGHADEDPKQAYTETVKTNADGSAVDDKKFKDGNFIHLEVDKNHQIQRLDQSDLANGQIHHKVRQPDGQFKETRDLLT